MKKWWLLVCVAMCTLSVSAQNNFFFGHYMLNPSYFNPAWIGGEEVAFVAFQHRTQWLGYSSSFDGSGGAPSTQMLTAAVPFQNFFISSVGINISNDDLGPVGNFQVHLPISFSKAFRTSSISLGVAPSVFSQTQKFDELRFNDPTDPLNNQSRETQTQPDLNAGIFFRTDGGFFIGASALNILQPGFDFGLDSLENIQEISYALHGGNRFSLGNDLSISPTFLVRTDLNGFTFDAGALVTLREKMWGGLSYRRKESAIIYLGYSLLPGNKLKVGYSFDYVIQSQRGKAATSHEIFIRYDLPNLVFGGRKSVKTPRFSF